MLTWMLLHGMLCCGGGLMLPVFQSSPFKDHCLATYVDLQPSVSNDRPPRGCEWCTTFAMQLQKARLAAVAWAMHDVCSSLTLTIVRLQFELVTSLGS